MNENNSEVFHFAFKVKDIISTVSFYHELLGCTIGRQTSQWIDIDFFGNQISAHVSENKSALDFCGVVDGTKVPIPHFGCVLNKNDFNEIKNRLMENNLDFILKPQSRYKGKIGEQETMFILDYSGNPLEFKCLVEVGNLFS